MIDFYCLVLILLMNIRDYLLLIVSVVCINGG